MYYGNGSNIVVLTLGTDGFSLRTESNSREIAETLYERRSKTTNNIRKYVA